MKVFLLVLLACLSIFVLPLVLQFFHLAGDFGFPAATQRIEADLGKNLFLGPSLLMDDAVREPWAWAQIPVIIIALRLVWGIWRQRRRERGLSPEDVRSTGGGQYGTARWRNTASLIKTLGGLKGPQGGFVVGVRKKTALRSFDAWVDAGDTHCLVIGATRSGKSRRIILPTIWTLARAGESMIITDPKGELHSRSKTYLERQGYKVERIDLREPLNGLRWNLLQPVTDAFERRDAGTAGQAAWDAAHVITYQRPHQGDPIWPQAQESLTAALMLAVAAEAPPDRKTMAECYELLHSRGGGDGEELDAYLQGFSPGHPARSAYGVAALSSDRLRSSIFTGTAAQLRLWADPAVAWLTGADETDVQVAGRQKAAVFLVIPDERGTRNVLASLYIAQCYQALADLGNAEGAFL